MDPAERRQRPTETEVAIAPAAARRPGEQKRRAEGSGAYGELLPAERLSNTEVDQDSA